MLSLPPALLVSLAAGLFGAWKIAAVAALLIVGTGFLAGLAGKGGSLLRIAARLLAPWFWNIDQTGFETLPATGGLLLVGNHVAATDSLLLLGRCPRPLRFIAGPAALHHPLLGPILRTLGAIPLQIRHGRRSLQHSAHLVANRLAAGDALCLFAEGNRSRLGFMLPFRPVFAWMLRQAAQHRPNAWTIVPFAIDGTWRSMTSAGRLPLTELDLAWLHDPVALTCGKPQPATTPLATLRRQVQQLSTSAWMRLVPQRPPLTHLLINTFRRRIWRLAIADTRFPSLSRFGTLLRALVLGHAWDPILRGQGAVGILLPPSVPTTLANLALVLGGHPVVNLNYSAGREAIASAIRQSGIKTVITHPLFLEKANLSAPAGVDILRIDQQTARHGFPFILAAAFLALAAPIRTLERWCGATRPPRPEDPVTFIFTSGSTGEPKGVPLTHANLVGNVLGIDQNLGLTPDHRVLGILPFFHSFGFVFLWIAMIRGVAIPFQPNPLDPDGVGDLVERYRLDLLIATPTFLQIYLRKVPPAKFASLRRVVTGAEKLPGKLAHAFAERFGVMPDEGYGCTECSPVVSVGVPTLRHRDARGHLLKQVGLRPGHIGPPLAGVSIRIIDPDTGRDLPDGEPGLMLVKGANVMSGYLHQPELSATVLEAGWYRTGDIALVTRDGFLRITDRLSRFSKIAGEMIPHGTIEEALQDAAGLETRGFAVTGVPDDRRGERLAVLHIMPEESVPILIQALVQRGFPNIYIPKREQFIKVEGLPVLGSGKLDLRVMRQLAQAHFRSLITHAHYR